MRTTLFSLATTTMLCLGLSTETVVAGPEPYIGDIIMVGQSWCPRGWARTDGSVLNIADYQALFSILGATYGGNGRTTFALPDLRSRTPVGNGTGPDLAPVAPGEKFGQERVTLTEQQMPAHTHTATSTAQTTLNATTAIADQQSPDGNAIAELPQGRAFSSNGTLNATLRADTGATTVTTTIGSAGGSQPVNLHQPSLGVTFCIAVQGLYPPRN